MDSLYIHFFLFSGAISGYSLQVLARAFGPFCGLFAAIRGVGIVPEFSLAEKIKAFPAR